MILGLRCKGMTINLHCQQLLMLLSDTVFLLFRFEEKTRFIGSRRLRRFHGVNGFPFILRILREIIDIHTQCPLHVPQAHSVKRFVIEIKLNLLCVETKCFPS